MATGAFGGVGAGLRGMQSAPLWAYLGGVLGVTFVLGSIVAIPQVGVVVVICAAILGQMVGSYLADTFGWFGVARVPFSPVRLVGNRAHAGWSSFGAKEIETPAVARNNAIRV